MSVLVFVNASGGKLNKNAFEATLYGKKTADLLGTDLNVVTFGNVDEGAVADLGNSGATKVILHKTASEDPQQLTRLVTLVADQTSAKVIVFSQDNLGKIIAPRVSAKLDAGHAPGANGLPDTSASFDVPVNVFSGKAFATISIHTDVKVISVLPNSIPLENIGGSAVVEESTADLGNPGIIVKEIKSDGGALPLPEAELVVSGGRGLKGPENWGLIEDLANALGAATACSRPVADSDWRPHHEHVGQTGVAIRPNLYIAAGISGAIQHLAGVNGSKTIVVINTDPEAPFFKAADYGIVGDAFEVLPRLTDAVKKFRSNN